MEYEGVLPDGTRMLVRKIRPDDKGKLAAGFARLSDESRYRRFFSQMDHLSEEQLKYLTEVDFEDHYAWIAELPDEPGVPGVAVARWIRIASEPEVAESAITVVDDYQDQGIGSTMLWVLSRSAIEKGIKAFRVWVQGENIPVLEMLKDFGIVPRGWESGVSEIDIPLPSDVNELDKAPARIVLRQVASGEVRAEQQDRTGAGARIVPRSDPTGS